MLKRVELHDQPYRSFNKEKSWFQRGVWPCKWVTVSEAPQPPFAAVSFVAAYRLRFHLDQPAVIRAHVTADERYELFLDGQRAARGSERGSLERWFYESYDLSLPAGDHTLVARVWSLGGQAPWAQMSAYHGFLFATEGDWIPLLATGVAPWEAKLLPGYTFTDPSPAWGTGANLIVDGSKFAWGFEKGLGDGWQPAAAHYTAMVPERAEGIDPDRSRTTPEIHWLVPATLPAMISQPVSTGIVRFAAHYRSLLTQTPSLETGWGITDQAGSDAAVDGAVPIRMVENDADTADRWNRLLRKGEPVAVPAGAKLRVLIDLEDYYCAYPQLQVSRGAGASIRVLWAESLFQESAGVTKGHRDEIEGKYFYGVGDTFLMDGASARTFDTLWWQAGRYIEILVETQDEPLTIERFGLTETRYPLEMQASFASDDPRLERAVPVLLRGLQMCTHETYFDCPYYEQLMYIGDTRLEALVTYAIQPDDRLPRKALEMFSTSRMINGLTRSRFPSRVRQTIPPFSLWFTGMVYDHALWRGSPDFIRSLMPVVRGVLDAFLSCRNEQGLIIGPPGWNYFDWAPEWDGGVPPDGDFGANAAINWLAVLAMGWASALEEWLGEPELSQRWDRYAGELAQAVISAFWDPSRSRFSDETGHRCASEHAQALALLSGRLTAEMQEGAAQSLLRDGDLTRTTIYMTHYLLEAFRRMKNPQALFERLNLWFDLENHGFKTTPEMPEPSRSDCHGWGSSPLFHYYATILGIRPDSFGFSRVRIEPLSGSLARLSGRMPHPLGWIETDLCRGEDGLHGIITLPQSVTGVFVDGERQVDLREGSQVV